MASSTPTPGGRIVCGKYRVEGVLGEGQTGMLVAATHLALRELVAIKLVRAGGRVAPERALARFSRQARALAKIRSEHVVRVHDVGMLEDGRGAYMVLEYLEGQDLAAWVRDAGALPIERAVEYALQACEALAEAHVFGVVHGSVEAKNLFLTTRPDGSSCIKLLDFGVAVEASESTRLPEDELLVGGARTPAQLRGAPPDPRTDLFGLGATLFELLTGAPPFGSGDESRGAALVERAASTRDRGPDLPAELDEVLRRCLATDPADRFPDVAALAAALVPFGPHREAARSAARVSRVFETAGVPVSTLGSDIPTIPSLPALPTPKPARAPTRSDVSTSSQDDIVGVSDLALAGPRPRRRTAALGVSIVLALAAGIVAMAAARGVANSPMPASAASAPAIASPPVDPPPLATAASAEGVTSPAATVAPEEPSAPAAASAILPRRTPPTPAVPRASSQAAPSEASLFDDRK